MIDKTSINNLTALMSPISKVNKNLLFNDKENNQNFNNIKEKSLINNFNKNDLNEKITKNINYYGSYSPHYRSNYQSLSKTKSFFNYGYEGSRKKVNNYVNCNIFKFNNLKPEHTVEIMYEGNLEESVCNDNEYMNNNFLDNSSFYNLNKFQQNKILSKEISCNIISKDNKPNRSQETIECTNKNNNYIDSLEYSKLTNDKNNSYYNKLNEKSENFIKVSNLSLNLNNEESNSYIFEKHSSKDQACYNSRIPDNSDFQKLDEEVLQSIEYSNINKNLNFLNNHKDSNNCSKSKNKENKDQLLSRNLSCKTRNLSLISYNIDDIDNLKVSEKNDKEYKLADYNIMSTNNNLNTNCNMNQSNNKSIHTTLVNNNNNDNNISELKISNIMIEEKDKSNINVISINNNNNYSSNNYINISNNISPKQDISNIYSNGISIKKNYSDNNSFNKLTPNNIICNYEVSNNVTPNKLVFNKSNNNINLGYSYTSNNDKSKRTPLKYNISQNSKKVKLSENIKSTALINNNNNNDDNNNNDYLIVSQNSFCFNSDIKSYNDIKNNNNNNSLRNSKKIQDKTININLRSLLFEANNISTFNINNNNLSPTNKCQSYLNEEELNNNKRNQIFNNICNNTNINLVCLSQIIDNSSTLSPSKRNIIINKTDNSNDSNSKSSKKINLKLNNSKITKKTKKSTKVFKSNKRNNSNSNNLSNTLAMNSNDDHMSYSTIKVNKNNSNSSNNDLKYKTPYQKKDININETSNIINTSNNESCCNYIAYSNLKSDLKKTEKSVTTNNNVNMQLDFQNSNNKKTINNSSLKKANLQLNIDNINKLYYENSYTIANQLSLDKKEDLLITNNNLINLFNKTEDAISKNTNKDIIEGIKNIVIDSPNAIEKKNCHVDNNTPYKNELNNTFGIDNIAESNKIYNYISSNKETIQHNDLKTLSSRSKQLKSTTFCSNNHKDINSAIMGVEQNSNCISNNLNLISNFTPSFNNNQNLNKFSFADANLFSFNNNSNNNKKISFCSNMNNLVSKDISLESYLVLSSKNCKKLRNDNNNSNNYNNINFNENSINSKCKFNSCQRKVSSIISLSPQIKCITNNNHNRCYTLGKTNSIVSNISYTSDNKRIMFSKKPSLTSHIYTNSLNNNNNNNKLNNLKNQKLKCNSANTKKEVNKNIINIKNLNAINNVNKDKEQHNILQNNNDNNKTINNYISNNSITNKAINVIPTYNKISNKSSLTSNDNKKKCKTLIRTYNSTYCNIDKNLVKNDVNNIFSMNSNKKYSLKCRNLSEKKPLKKQEEKKPIKFASKSLSNQTNIMIDKLLSSTCFNKNMEFGTIKVMKKANNKDVSISNKKTQNYIINKNYLKFKSNSNSLSKSELNKKLNKTNNFCKNVNSASNSVNKNNNNYMTLKVKSICSSSNASSKKSNSECKNSNNLSKNNNKSNIKALSYKEIMNNYIKSKKSNNNLIIKSGCIIGKNFNNKSLDKFINNNITKNSNFKDDYINNKNSHTIVTNKIKISNNSNNKKQNNIYPIGKSKVNDKIVVSRNYNDNSTSNNDNNSTLKNKTIKKDLLIETNYSILASKDALYNTNSNSNKLNSVLTGVSTADTNKHSNLKAALEMFKTTKFKYTANKANENTVSCSGNKNVKSNIIIKLNKDNSSTSKYKNIVKDTVINIKTNLNPVKYNNNNNYDNKDFTSLDKNIKTKNSNIINITSKYTTSGYDNKTSNYNCNLFSNFISSKNSSNTINNNNNNNNNNRQLSKKKNVNNFSKYRQGK